MTKPKISREERKLRESARGEACTFRIPGICSHDPDTTVLCHAHSELHGVGIKGSALFGAYGCYACHAALDQHRVCRDDENYYWLRGIDRTHRRMLERGVLVVA